MPAVQPHTGALDFADCIRLAVERSPYLKGPALEIQVKKLDEKDAWYHLFPSLFFTLLSDRKIAGDDDSSTMKTGEASLTLGLSSGAYNPIAAWIQYDTQKDITRLAKMGALLSLQEIIQQIATAYTTLDYLERQIALRREILDVNERSLVYATKLEHIHTSPIDIKIAIQKKNLAQTEYTMAVMLRGQILINLRSILGMSPYELIQPDTRSFCELIKNYNPDGYRYEYAEQNNIRMQMQALKAILSEKEVTAQWIKALPTFSLGIRQPDKVNNQTDSDTKEYYFSSSMQIPIWQWGETSRAFDRAEIKKRQTQYDNESDRLRFRSSWMMKQMEAQQQRALSELAESEVDLAKLSWEKRQVEFRAGQIPYKDALATELAVVQAKLRANELRKNYYTSLILMVSDTGDLMRRFVNIEDYADAP